MSFDDLIGFGGKPLRFDFKVFINDTDFAIIEYDGMGHEDSVNLGGCSNADAKKAFDTTRRHDLIKNDFCLWEGINLL